MTFFVICYDKRGLLDESYYLLQAASLIVSDCWWDESFKERLL